MVRLRYFIALLLLSGMMVWIQCGQKTASYASLDPATQYVGNTTCKSCHERIYTSYLETGMGKSFYVPDKNKIIESFSSESLVFDAHSGYYYHPFWKADSLFIREFRLNGKDTTYQRTEKINYIVGSGNQTRSYILERNGYLYEVPVTWYVSKQMWDLSPGYHDGKNSRFSREIVEDCMACHTGYFEYEAGSKHRFRNIGLGIDCERCHGPGSAHVREMQAENEVDVSKEIDYSIVNPAKLPIDQQFDVCQQCHLQGTNVLNETAKSIRDFRPGMNLSDIFHVYVEKNKEENQFGIASHADRLKQSQCFIQSEGKLNCTTCHDPHESIHKTDTTLYVKQCNACHNPKTHPEKMNKVTCTEKEENKLAVKGNCISCHLPQGGTSDIPHVRFHDHKIRVVKKEILKTEAEIQREKQFIEIVCANAKDDNPDRKGKANLLYFEQQNPSPEYLKIAGENLSPGSHYEQARVAYYKSDYSKALKEVTEALKTQPDNALCLFLQGEILEKQGEFPEAFTAYDKAYNLNTASVEAGLKAVVMLLNARKGERNALSEAEKRLGVLLKQKPLDERIHSNLGFVLLNQSRIPEAERAFRRAIAINPDYKQAVENMKLIEQLR